MSTSISSFLPPAEPAADPTISVPVRALAPTFEEVASLGLLWLLVALLYALSGFETINVVSPPVLTLILGIACWRLVRTYPAALWTPVFSLRLSATVYLGIGSVLPHLFGPVFEDFVLGLYAYSPQEEAKVHLIFLTFLLAVLGGARITSHLMKESVAAPTSRLAKHTGALGALFFAIGFAIFILLLLPSSLGLLGIELPGSFVVLAEALQAGGIFLIALWAFPRGLKGALIIAALFLLIVSTGLILMNKTIIVQVQLLISLAYLMRGGTLRRLATVTVMLTFTFLVLQPMVAYQRERQQRTYGEAVVNNPAERLSFAVAWLTDPAVNESEAPATARLSYTAAAAFVVAQHDAGLPAETVRNAFVALVPRVFWPDKPIISDAGGDVYYLVTGRTGSQIGVTVPADLYWNVGWFGLAIIAFLCGPVLMVATTASYQIVATRDWLMMPFVVVAFRIGLSVDNAFVGTVFAPAVIALIIYGVLRVSKQVIAKPLEGVSVRG